jgi:hypothetical protein
MELDIATKPKPVLQSAVESVLRCAVAGAFMELDIATKPKPVLQSAVESRAQSTEYRCACMDEVLEVIHFF